MAISTIRKYTQADKARVKQIAERFCKRHDIDFNEYINAEISIDYWIDQSHPEDKAYNRKLWMACYCRALKVPCDTRTTTGWGYIGVQID